MATPDDSGYAIKDIEPPSEYSKDSQLTKTIYVYFIRVEPPIGRGPHRTYVTDFTNNHSINHSILDDEVPKLLNISLTQLFQLDLYVERIREFEASFFQARGAHLKELAPPITKPLNLHNLGIFAKVRVKAKVFNSSLEGRGVKIEVLSKEWITSHYRTIPALKALCEAVKSSKYTNHVDIPDELLTTGNDLQSSHGFQSSTQSNSFGPIISEIMDDGFFEDNDSKDELTGDFIPGNVYSDDVDEPRRRGDISMNKRTFASPHMNNNSLNILSDSPAHSSPKKPTGNSIGSTSLTDSSGQNSIQFKQIASFPLSEICQMDLTLDNIVYPVEACLLGTLPEDWTHICVKRFETKRDKLHSTDPLIQVSDPFLRPIQLLLGDSWDGFSSKTNTLKVNVGIAQLERLFKNPIELLYSKPELIKQELSSVLNKKKTYKLFKKSVKIGDSSIVVWSMK